MTGLAPALIYAFSTSPTLNGVLTTTWNRRQQIINSKGIRSGIVYPESFPLASMQQYLLCLEETARQIEGALADQNPTFFCQEGMNPREVVARYRGSDWGFLKLGTDQVIRFNLGGRDGTFLETRCIDAQECIKATAALSYLGERVATAGTELDELLSLNGSQLRANVREATWYGDRGNVMIGTQRMLLPEYAKQIASVLLDGADGRYADLLIQRFENPPAKEIRAMVKGGKDIIATLATCLRENKTIYEVR
ncbi:hypothetical protein J4410_07550 [Candidatus Woesearchaeota archaeon]|nr:hypothetical protein [Candidatus Woesearchaeota archaeon]